MKSYEVEISFLDPYPRMNRFRIEGNNLSTIAGRALGAWRKEYKGRKIKRVTVHIQQL